MGAVSEVTGVTVRTLHHYDEIGLLQPSERTAAGYRLYSDADLVRLHAILSWRDMGFALAEIAELLEEPDRDLALGLKRQRRRLAERSERISDMIRALDETIATIDGGDDMTDDDVRGLFDGFDPSRYEDEVNARWGETDPYAESTRRVSSYTVADLEQQRIEAADNVATFVRLLESGVSATDDRAIEAAREHGAIIDRWFYPLSPEMHLGLAEMYVTDPRFEATYEKAGSGLARYIGEAIGALHDR